MNPSFRNDIQSRPSEQLLNMVNNTHDWDDLQLKVIIEELENRGLINDDIQIIKDQLYTEEELELDVQNPQNEFERDLSVIYHADQKEKKQERFKTPALVLMLSIAGFYFAFFFNIPSAFGLRHEFIEKLQFIIYDLQYVTGLFFFIMVGLFIGRLYLPSLISSALTITGLIIAYLLY